MLGLWGEEMLTQITADKAAGKTVAKMTVIGKFAVATFTDGTFVFIEAGHIPYSDGSLELYGEDNFRATPSTYYDSYRCGDGFLADTGICTADELKAIRDKEVEEANAVVRREHEEAQRQERALFERLAKKYGAKAS